MAKLRERYFEKTDGGYLFVPNGVFSRRAYIVDDAGKAKLAAFMARRDYLTFIFAAIGASIGWWIAYTDGLVLGVMISAILVGIFSRFRKQQLLQGFAQTNFRRTFSKQLDRSAKIMPSLFIYAVLIGSVLVAALMIFLIYESARDGDRRGDGAARHRPFDGRAEYSALHGRLVFETHPPQRHRIV